MDAGPVKGSTPGRRRGPVRWMPLAVAAALAAATVPLARVNSDGAVWLAILGVLALAGFQVARPARHPLSESSLVCLVASIGLAVIVGWFYQFADAWFGDGYDGVGSFVTGFGVVLVAAAVVGLVAGLLARLRLRSLTTG